MVSPLFQRNLINNFIGKSPDQNGSERLEGHKPQAPVGAEAESPGEADTTPSSACGSSPLYRRALSGAALTVGRARAQHRKWSQSKCLHASLSPCPGLGGTLKSGSGQRVLQQRLGAQAAAAVTRGRARVGSLHSSTWPRGPGMCSRAAHSGKRSCT